MSIFNLYCDESGKAGDHPVVTFSGLLISQERLPLFETKWRQLLDTAGLSELHMKDAARLSRNYGTAMTRGQSYDQRIEMLKPFADATNEFFEAGFLLAMDVKGFGSLSELAKRAMGKPDEPLYLSFMRGTLAAVQYIGTDDRLSIICDHDERTSLICAGYYAAMRSKMSDVKDKTISISFADDKYFPALQAADMVAFFFRLEARRRIHRAHYEWVKMTNYLLKRRETRQTDWNTMIGGEAVLKDLGQHLEKLPMPEERKR